MCRFPGQAALRALLLGAVLYAVSSLLVAARAYADSPPVVAVSYFSNTSADSTLDPLRKGLADMLITDLAQMPGLRIVERDRLEALVAELRLQQSEYFDPASVQKLGKGLGASYVLTGSYLLAGEDLRVDVRIIRVDTAEIVAANQATGLRADVFDIEKELVTLLVDTLGVKLERAERRVLGTKPTTSFDAFTAYSQGLDAADRGDTERARAAFLAAVAADPAYAAAQTAAERLKAMTAVAVADDRKALDSILQGLDPKDPHIDKKLGAAFEKIASDYSEAAVPKWEALFTFIMDHGLRPQMGVAEYRINMETSWLSTYANNTLTQVGRPEACEDLAAIHEYLIAKYGLDMYTRSGAQMIDLCRVTAQLGARIAERGGQRDTARDAAAAALHRVVGRIPRPSPGKR